MTTNLSYSTYQQPPSEESLKEFSKHQDDRQDTFISKKLKVTALVMGFLVLAAFMLSTEILHQRKNALTKTVAPTDEPSKTFPTYIDTDSSSTSSSGGVDFPPATIDVDKYFPPEAEDEQPSSEDNEAPEETEEAQQEEEEAEVVVDSGSDEETYKPAIPDAPADTTEPVLPPVAQLDPGDPLHPRVSNAANMPVKVIRSDSRLSPLYMSYATTEFGWLRTLFSKYGFVGNRLTDPKKYTFPEAIQTSGLEGAAESWAYATMYSGSACKGDVQSIAGIANQECIPVAGFGGDKGQAIMMDCLSNGDVVMNAFNANDCSGAPISSAVLVVADTCYAFSYSLNEEAQESEYSASVRFACGTPELSTYNLQKVFLSADATATKACTDSDESLADGQIFEAFPTDTCVAQRQSDGNFFSLEFGKDDFENPLVTYIFGSTDCGASNAKAKTSSTELYTACADQAWQGGISVYGKWVYHP